MNLSTRTLHRVVGLLLVLPMLAWSVTGLVFFFKPGYTDAYAPLNLRTYPLESVPLPQPLQQWEDLRLLRTVLGYHLLARSAEGLVHLDPVTMQPRALPAAPALAQLVDDAIATRRERYGAVVKVDGTVVTTSTGVEIAVDWANLRLSQQGADTRLINALYRVHYLQWSGSDFFNRVLGVAGLLLVATLTVLGLRVYLRARGSRPS